MVDLRILSAYRQLYRRLLRGATMAEAVKWAREVARRCGDATWLAYTVYAHPDATLERTPAAEPAHP